MNTDGACFCANISISSITNAKLWGLFYGLDLAWKQRARDLLVEVDSKCTIQLIANTSNNHSSYSSLIHSIKELLNKNWHVCINHMHHEANFVPDFLTNFTKESTSLVPVPSRSSLWSCPFVNSWYVRDCFPAFCFRLTFVGSLIKASKVQ